VTIPLQRAAPAPGGAAPELRFRVVGAGPLQYAAVPTLRFELEVDAGGAAVRSATLETQIRVAAPKRAYDERARERLVDLFGRPDGWSRGVRSLHWTNLVTHVPAFDRRTRVDLLVPCAPDFELAVMRYLEALEEGEVPLEFLFSGSVFYAGGDGRLQVARIGWDKDAEFRMPLAAAKEAVARHFPDSGWLRLDARSFERLRAYRAEHTLLTWEATIDALLRGAGGPGR
jgi:hypothetical protein